MSTRISGRLDDLHPAYQRPGLFDLDDLTGAADRGGVLGRRDTVVFFVRTAGFLWLRATLAEALHQNCIPARPFAAGLDVLVQTVPSGHATGPQLRLAPWRAGPGGFRDP